MMLFYLLYHIHHRALSPAQRFFVSSDGVLTSILVESLTYVTPSSLIPDDIDARKANSNEFEIENRNKEKRTPIFFFPSEEQDPYFSATPQERTSYKSKEAKRRREQNVLLEDHRPAHQMEHKDCVHPRSRIVERGAP